MPKSIDALPQSGRWQLYVHKLRAWIPGDDEQPVRPYLMLVVSTDDGAFLACEPGDTPEDASGGNVVKEKPTAETVLRFLRRCMTHPRLMNTSKAGERRKPARPKTIRFADTTTASLHLGDESKWAAETACEYVEGCREGLKAIGVSDVSFAPVPPQLVNDIIRGQIEPNMAPANQEWGTQHLPGLMESVDGFTPAFGASLFGAAADFVRAAPWEKIASRRPIQLAYRLVLREDVAMKITSYGSVVGDAESGSFGLSVHKTVEDAMRAYKMENGDDGDDDAGAGEDGGQSCMFGSIFETPFEDIDAAEANAWDLAPMIGESDANAKYFPLFCKIAVEKGADGAEDSLSVTRPAIIELQCFELMMKAIVSLIKSGDLKSIGDDVRDGAGPWTVRADTMAGSTSKRGDAEIERAEIELSVTLPPIESAAGGGAYV
ncbi:uncharacterized protein MICPUCDRAFT_53410 [Micromonas pusilla CCMP1545]|jgi:hypothetical protein|uniref:Predicted protein n=2 Tax=Micromonas pusilla TaxID=38833 RepID=C1N6R5_MICPC|nr:uncharacterized protein MICPUCDRAFT_53410 [Micromonas pusilla CCMP1545]EEH52152.1 predicted protein [Micromonas pusilla CCMP1545]|eukprot:XP_003063779.1 predicted protein [Micromonas pusilla CCMP1545]